MAKFFVFSEGKREIKVVTGLEIFGELFQDFAFKGIKNDAAHALF